MKQVFSSTLLLFFFLVMDSIAMGQSKEPPKVDSPALKKDTFPLQKNNLTIATAKPDTSKSKKKNKKPIEDFENPYQPKVPSGTIPYNSYRPTPARPTSDTLLGGILKEIITSKKHN